jgi:hypothetical protein
VGAAVLEEQPERARVSAEPLAWVAIPQAGLLAELEPQVWAGLLVESGSKPRAQVAELAGALKPQAAAQPLVLGKLDGSEQVFSPLPRLLQRTKQNRYAKAIH